MFVNEFRIPCFIHNKNEQIKELPTEKSELLEKSSHLFDKLVRKNRANWKESEIISLKEVYDLIENKAFPAIGLLTEEEIVNILSNNTKTPDQLFIDKAKSIINERAEYIVMKCMERLTTPKSQHILKSEYDKIDLIQKHLRISLKCINCNNMEELAIRLDI